MKKLHPTFVIHLAVFAAFLAHCGKQQHAHQEYEVKEAWDFENDPELFGVVTQRFASLPLEGRLADKNFPWSDSYWPTREGGTAHRWQLTSSGTSYKDFRYKLHNATDFIVGSKETEALVATLSPAEKYDLYKSRYDFPLVRAEFANQQKSVNPATGDVPNWYGLCHGWAPATLHEPEPGAVAVVTNAEGITIPFYTSDINALISKVYADFLPGSITVGSRCNTANEAIKRDARGRVLDTNCRDTNPGTLHLVLAQLLGDPDPLRRRGFLADVTHDAEVWNQAVVGYKVKLAETTPLHRAMDPFYRHHAAATHSLMRVKTEVFYVGEIEAHSTPQLEYKESYTSSIELDYILELDRRGAIVGGEWISSDRPDFLWNTYGLPYESDIVSYEAVRLLSEESRKPAQP